MRCHFLRLGADVFVMLADEIGPLDRIPVERFADNFAK
jgi:hypothetical protein